MTKDEEGKKLKDKKMKQNMIRDETKHEPKDNKVELARVKRVKQSSKAQKKTTD